MDKLENELGIEKPIYNIDVGYAHGPTRKSESIKLLAVALAKAQAVMEDAKKSSNNPYFRSRYADLQSVWDAARKPLTDNGLSVVQIPGKDSQGHYLDTLLLHNSGEWIEGRMYTSPVKDDPQGIGSAITYARRYSLQSFVGIAPDDDDGEASMGRGNAQIRGKIDTAPQKIEPKNEEARSSPKATIKKAPTPRKRIQQLEAACAINNMPVEFIASKFKEQGYIAVDENVNDAADEILAKTLEHFQWFVDKYKKENE